VLYSAEHPPFDHPKVIEMLPRDDIEKINGGLTTSKKLNIGPVGVLTAINIINRSSFKSMADMPASMIALIQVKRNGAAVTWGSGALVDKDIILTSTHLVNNKDNKYVVALGYDTKMHTPSTEKIISIQHHPDPEVDLSIILIGNKKKAWFEIGTGVAPNHEVIIAGYGYTYMDGGLHCSFGSTHIEAPTGTELRYTINTKSGDSGAPIYDEENGLFKIVGVHLLGEGDFMTGNKGVFLNSYISSDIRKMISSIRAKAQ
jgi:V8-like Glu-specific endopeptidase